MLRAGFAAIDISPPQENSLLGYEFRQNHLPPGNSGVHDPLLAHILVLHDGTQPAAIVSLDICILLPPLARHLRQVIGAKLGITSERVLLSCTHTHSGPFPLRPEDADKKGFLSTFVDDRARDVSTQDSSLKTQDSLNPDAAYAAFLERQLLDAAPRAANLLFPVRIESQQAPCGIAYTRRHVQPDGTVTLIWNPQESKTLETASQDSRLTAQDSSLLPTADPTCTLIIFRQTNGPRVFHVWSLGAHPTVMGKTATHVSADWPGLACAQLDAVDPTGNTHALFLLGPCGDTHAWIATQESYANLALVSAAASSFVTLLTHAAHASSTDALIIANKTLSIGETEVDLSAWKIGDALILAAPVELFANLGAALRAHFPRTHVVIATNTQGWTGYWPTREAFALGDYEINAARAMHRQPGDGETLIAELATLAGHSRQQAE